MIGIWNPSIRTFNPNKTLAKLQKTLKEIEQKIKTYDQNEKNLENWKQGETLDLTIYDGEYSFRKQFTSKTDPRLFEHDKKEFKKMYGSSQGWKVKKTEVLQQLYKTYGIWISKYESDLKKVEEFLEKREEQRKKRIRKWGNKSPQVKEIEADIRETLADLDVYKKKVDNLQFERNTLGELLEPQN